MRRAVSIVFLWLLATPAKAEWNDGVDIHKVFLGAYPEPSAYYVMLDVSEGDNFILYSKLLIYGPGSEGAVVVSPSDTVHNSATVKTDLSALSP